jgi:hypothetical protein
MCFLLTSFFLYANLLDIIWQELTESDVFGPVIARVSARAAAFLARDSRAYEAAIAVFATPAPAAAPTASCKAQVKADVKKPLSEQVKAIPRRVKVETVEVKVFPCSETFETLKAAESKPNPFNDILEAAEAVEVKASPESTLDAAPKLQPAQETPAPVGQVANEAKHQAIPRYTCLPTHVSLGLYHCDGATLCLKFPALVGIAPSFWKGRGDGTIIVPRATICTGTVCTPSGHVVNYKVYRRHPGYDKFKVADVLSDREAYAHFLKAYRFVGVLKREERTCYDLSHYPDVPWSPEPAQYLASVPEFEPVG